MAINDLTENGNQPFKLDETTVFINGEIYNHKKLKSLYFKDTKFFLIQIVRLFSHVQKFGIDFLNMLDGFFSILILDNKKNKIYLIKDSFGKKPILQA